MRAADNRNVQQFSEVEEDNTKGLEQPQYLCHRRYEEIPQMRVEVSVMSDASHSIPQRAALAEEEVEDVEEVQEEDILEPTEQTLPDRSHEMESAGRSTLEVELASKEREVSHLVDEMQRLQSSINNLKEISTSKISQLQGIVTEKDRIIKELAEKLLKQQDYSDLKRELRLLKSLELGGWQSWCSDQTETASPAEVKLVTDGVDSSAGPIALPGEESRSPGSGVQEEPIPVLTPPSALELTPPSAPEPACVGGVSVEQLQHCLRVNVDRFSNESLNTLSISRCVRELLSMNNIGQRLFAKLVLGLSQGTVSELLSKPKPWDKLTEKGRDSYRKMHAWACDQHCISLLKSLLPKKGRESGLMKQEGSVTEERVSQLMNEAQNAVLTNGHSTPDKQEVIALPKESIDSRREIVPHSAGYPDMLNGSKALHYGPEFPPVMLAHIYQEELVKLIGKRIKEGYTDDHMKQAQDDIRQALSIYHRELALLAQGGPPPPPDSMSACHTCSVRRSDCGLPYCRDQPCCMPPDGNSFPFVSTEGNSMKVMSPYSGTSPLVPLSEVPPTSDESSPLQRMQSITNSLLSQSSTPTFSTLPQRPAKAILPPITQQQFDQYNNLNTEDIVKKVKEQLSQYSISQRLFGESVLGLSQGSVSDLLARPKPWHMLTQKGREPFIRMKMFLEDENAVHKLVASQYKIAPERLMRMGGYGGVAIPPGSTRFSPHVTEPSYPLHRPMLESRQPIKPAHPASPQPPSTPESPAVPLTAHSPSGSAALPSSGNLKPNRRGHARCLPYVQPSVYEMAAVTTDLDTQMITSRIKETLTVHNIGQKLFGEAVLGLSQGSVSELLSKPKPWHMLSIKGREPFIRMQLWLNDPSNVEKLQAIKTERREANKRRRSSVEPDAPVHCEKPPQYPLDLPPVFLYPPVKKPRILFSEEQKEALKLAYTLDPYPSTAVMEFLSSELGLSVRTITNWFHNHRMRLKQQQPGDVGDQDGPPFQQQGIEGVTFDPIRFRMMLSQRLAEMCSKPPPQQSQQQQAAVYAGDLQRLGPPYRLCQPLSPPEQEVGTLDLSMSSQQFPHRDSREQEPLSLESERSTSATPETQSETHDSKCQSESDNSQLTPTEDRHLTTVATLATSSSNRRKAAAPQWVNPVLDLSPDSDLCSFGEDDEEDEEEKADTSIPPKHIINGVCVRQTNLAIHEDEEEATVHIEPAPVPDSLTSLPAEGSSQVEQQARIEREKNIRRLERALAEQEESWDITESEDDENSSNDYADSSRL